VLAFGRRSVKALVARKLEFLLLPLLPCPLFLFLSSFLFCFFSLCSYWVAPCLCVFVFLPFLYFARPCLLVLWSSSVLFVFLGLFSFSALLCSFPLFSSSPLFVCVFSPLSLGLLLVRLLCFFFLLSRFCFSVSSSCFSRSSPFSPRPFSGFYKAREGLVPLPSEMAGILEARDRGLQKRHRGRDCWIFPC